MSAFFWLFINYSFFNEWFSRVSLAAYKGFCIKPNKILLFGTLSGWDVQLFYIRKFVYQLLLRNKRWTTEQRNLVIQPHINQTQMQRTWTTKHMTNPIARMLPHYPGSDRALFFLIFLTKSLNFLCCLCHNVHSDHVRLFVCSSGQLHIINTVAMVAMSDYYKWAWVTCPNIF